MPSAPTLVLASRSPRRRALLEQLGLRFRAVATNADETPPRTTSPSKAILVIAERKLDAYAATASRRGPPGFVLAVDTEVVIGRRLFGKPGDAAHAHAMLEELSGRTHRVITGLVLQTPTKRRHRTLVESRVTLARLSQGQIRSYVKTGEPFDKAGGYAVQGQGAALIKNVRGDYTNVVGLPLRATLRLLRDSGYPLPPHLRI